MPKGKGEEHPMKPDSFKAAIFRGVGSIDVVDLP